MNKERGNILFLILLAVVLFAALSYAVTSSMRGGGKSGSAEKIRSEVSTLLQYAAHMQNTINRVMLVDGCKSAEINFNNSRLSGYNNTDAPAKCGLFDQTNGAKLEFRGISPLVLDPTLSGTGLIDYGFWAVYDHIKLLYAGNEEIKDLVLYVPYLTDEACLEINKMAGVNSIPSVARFADGGTNRRFHGDWYTGSYKINPQVDLTFGCMNGQYIYGSNTKYNVMYYLLLGL